MFEFLVDCVKAKETYVIRFGVVMFLDYYMQEQYLDKIFVLLQNITNEDYYVKMAIAWNLSICYVKFPKKTYRFLEEQTLKNDVLLKTLQKIRESRQISKEEKLQVQSLKHKDVWRRNMEK